MLDENDILNSINTNSDQGYRSAANPENSEDNYSKKKEVLAFIWETVKIVTISLAIIIPIRYYLVQPFFVKGASMEQSFHDGDYLLIDEISYRFSEPRRGDVIVFRYPENPSQFYIKRIIGLPGETVEVKNNKVKIYNNEFKTGFVPKEYYISDGQETFGNTSLQLKDDEYFVMGDNRLQSSDSRRWGAVPKSNITGKAFVRLWPVTKITKVEVINY